MPVELHLPDLPEVPITLGPARDAARRVRQPWHLRLRDTLVAYLPLLLMALLALFTWWLVKNTPMAPGVPEERALRQEPDYTMQGFTLERFDAEGRLKLRLEGREMRHYPHTDRSEVDAVQLRAVAPDGRVTLASARRAIANGDASEVQLVGNAQVSGLDAGGAPFEMKSEFLHAFLVSERVQTHLPVEVTSAGSVFRAGGLRYDHAARRIEMDGPMRGVFPPGVR